MDNLNIYQEERPWGNFRQFTHNIISTVKIITVKPNESLSLQSHEKRTEFWRVIKGEGIAHIDGKDYNIKEGEEYSIPVHAKHSLASGNFGVQVLEIATGDFDENDIVRYEDKYGRV
jgi:mannose-1-phosphate guanylyltransferase/mannose-1-phosphate guanylyltransferase/mannose-6-phosphate isomerase